MPSTLIPIKTFLGKYYPELAALAEQDKYVHSNISSFFPQRFHIQNNKTQMIIDHTLEGLQIIVIGNEIRVSKLLFDHSSVDISNSMEIQSNNNPKGLYDSEVFSTMAYLVCQNHTMFHIIGDIDEPIYIQYRTHYETFYNSVIIFHIDKEIDVEIVEEFNSLCAMNIVANYVLQPQAHLKLTTFYQNHIAALSFCLRNTVIMDDAYYNHTLFGKGSSNVVDEHRIYTNTNSSAELFACIDANQHNFHSIVCVRPENINYSLILDQRHVVSGKGKITFTPLIIGTLPEGSSANITSINTDTLHDNIKQEQILEFLLSITERATLDRSVGVDRFYDNKSKFYQFH
jgi:hypothetical protein